MLKDKVRFREYKSLRVHWIAYALLTCDTTEYEAGHEG